MARQRKLTDKEVLRMRYLYAVRERLLAEADGLTIRLIADRYGVSYSTAHDVIHGETYKEI